MPVGLRVQVFGQPATDLIEDQADQWLGAVYVRGRHDEIERGWFRAAHNVGDAPVATRRDLRHDRIAIETEKAHRCGEHAGALVVRLIQQLSRGRGHDRMRSSFALVCGFHHRGQRRLDGARRIGQEAGDASQGLVLLGIENVKDGADQKRVARLLPMVPAF